MMGWWEAAHGVYGSTIESTETDLIRSQFTLSMIRNDIDSKMMVNCDDTDIDHDGDNDNNDS